MGASIYWRDVSKGHKSVPVAGPSAFVESMRRAFGNEPWRLDSGSLDMLRGMAATYGNGDNPYDFLIDRIARESDFATIEVWPEY